MTPRRSPPRDDFNNRFEPEDHSNEANHHHLDSPPRSWLRPRITGSAAAAKPDVGCMQAGISTLQSARLLDDVARDGIAIETAVSLGVTVRPGADISGVPNPIPFSLLLADHRAGESSAFVYPGARSSDTRGPAAT